MLANGNFRHRHTVLLVGEISWSQVDPQGELVLQPLRNSQPVQVIMRQSWQTTLVLLSPSDQTCCSIQNGLQLVCDYLRCRSRNRVAVINPWCDKSMNHCLNWTSNDRRTRISWRSLSQKKHVWHMVVKTEVWHNRQTKNFDTITLWYPIATKLHT